MGLFRFDELYGTKFNRMELRVPAVRLVQNIERSARRSDGFLGIILDLNHMTSETRRVARKPDTAPAPDSSGWSGTLPEDVLRASARRLMLFCGVAAGSWTAAVAVENIFKRPGSATPFPWPGNLIAAIVVALLLGAQALIRSRAKRDCAVTIDLGLFLLVINAVGIALLDTWLPLPEPVDTRFISWITVVILVHAMIAPSTPRKTFGAALVAASMDPLALALAHARGVQVPSFAEAASLYGPNYICAFIAIVPAAVMHGLGRQIKKARELGSYQLVELLGKGGMGEVWRAEHRLLARPAAIKLVRPDALNVPGDPSTDLILRRFEREAQATAVLNSPHTIDLYDFGTTSDGNFYYVMELLHGRDLESFVRKFGPMSADRAVFLLRQICHSLAEAHVRGLVHRDIKPANIYNCRMGLEYDFIKVLDFGLVSFAYPGGPSPLMTGERLTTGTPAYMAPEVILGATEIDNRADVYSLGCVAYWLLTGHLVFEADSSVKMLMHHVQTPPVPPSQRSELPIPRELDDLVMACLAKDPNQRPQRADELWKMTMCCRSCERWDQDAARQWWETHLPELTQPLVLAMPLTPSPAEQTSVGSQTGIELTL
jgi:serine/threonine-protein kinase